MSIASNENIKLPIFDQFSILLLISILLTIVVYGLVLLIVRSDDFAIYLIEKQTKIFIKKLGYYLIKIIPYLLKILSVIGTFAMIFIGGEIIFNAIQHYLPLNLDGLNLFLSLELFQSIFVLG